MGVLFSIFFAFIASGSYEDCRVHLSDLASTDSLTSYQRPLLDVVDAAVVVFVKDKKLFLTQRTGSVGEGTWAFVGGKIEPGESPIAAAIRESKEEVGVKLRSLKHLFTTFSFLSENQTRYRVFLFLAESFDGDLKILEPHRLSQGIWFDPMQLPRPLFEANESYLTALLQKLREEKVLDAPQLN